MSTTEKTRRPDDAEDEEECVTKKARIEAEIVEEKSPTAASQGSTDASGVVNAAELPSERAKQADRFRYGNYNQYYGHRLEEKFQLDPRLELLQKEWFRNRAVLDVGCNAGIVTINVAKEFEPRRIVGIDIDPMLVGIARKNIRHYCEGDVELVGGKYPKAASKKTDFPKYPDNLWFICGNYVLESDEMLEMVRPEYDVIMALSISKWVHLNWGDEGLKRFFRRAFKHLKPGGRFILEPQEFSTYRKRAVKCPDMKKNYENIKLKPEDFPKFLLEDVGFARSETLGIPKTKVKGFQRHLIMFQK